MVLHQATGLELMDTDIITSDSSTESDVALDTCDPEVDFDFVEVAKLVPLRLSMIERKLMRLLDSTLTISEYTDKVDVISGVSKNRIILRETKEIFSVLTALAVAYNYDAGKKLLNEQDYYSNREFFCNIFEIGRRYKILNPDKMRSSYGKLIYFLMDTQKPEIKEILNFNTVVPVNTVYSFLQNKKNGLKLLNDPNLKHAIQCIIPENKNRNEIDKEIRKKEEAIKYLVNKYCTVQSVGQRMLNFSFLHRNFYSKITGSDDESDTCELTSDDIEKAIYSLNDYNTNIVIYILPINKMIHLLTTNYHPTNPYPTNPYANDQSSDQHTTDQYNTDPHSSDHYMTNCDNTNDMEYYKCEYYSLNIRYGRNGSRLNHTHDKQYNYVLQTLTLWKEICTQLYNLWYCAEGDLLSDTNRYQLKNTGQGLNRIQECHNVYNIMRKILKKVQSKLHYNWIGSSTIHLGDHNVPNSLLFIDKYLQIPRILIPILTCIENLPKLYTSNENVRKYINNEFGSITNLKMAILTDFFRHGFDGSGADNFNDAGSCIDGRLTSAWNWCNQIEKKNYYNFFLLTGFNGFDGRFNE
ncbi:uncharacterized protein TA11040 [Theileria annulata]|uniref:Non-canonical E2 ubiquitin-conjugating enzyme C-terminal domain-containing protein n=1 Tax=Theileria annulata TaxID=5874 RepID=Q4U999_THEAN|nr:uncharacterized protein TA11040 [Theileria annulata]CAI76604.1 hypothetical protein, conserved [Theileria annulata]|eukprot:XP_953229.1 hypothetical protein, conserved [Theileria annulata]